MNRPAIAKGEGRLSPVKDQTALIIRAALDLAQSSQIGKLFLFHETEQDCSNFLSSEFAGRDMVVLVLPQALDVPGSEFRRIHPHLIRNWSGNQTRFSRIKYAFLQGVISGVIRPDDKVVCVLGPSGKSHLDTITIHDLSRSWSEEFPFDVTALIQKRNIHTVMAVVDIALDIGALGREGKSVGTIFVIGDTENVMKRSHQAVFNPFRGYPGKERFITLPEVVESIKELAKLDGAIIITDGGVVEAAGRNLDAPARVSKKLRGLGSRHRAAAGITRTSEAVAIVVSESTGRVTLFYRGGIAGSLEPLISRRLV